jgi:hypothetical protein
MARSPLTETIARVQGMIAYVRENLNPGEYDLFLDLVDPQPEPAPAKKKRTKRGSKSSRASGLAAAIKNSLEAQKKASTISADQGDDSGPLCGTCGNTEDFQDHFRPSPNYHEFEGPKPVARAGRKSKQKPGETSSAPSSEIESETAIAAGGSAGD